jgi:hypothetical protein
MFVKGFPEFADYRTKLRVISDKSLAAKLTDAVFQSAGGHSTDYN